MASMTQEETGQLDGNGSACCWKDATISVRWSISRYWNEAANSPIWVEQQQHSLTGGPERQQPKRWVAGESLAKRRRWALSPSEKDEDDNNNNSPLGFGRSYFAKLDLAALRATIALQKKSKRNRKPYTYTKWARIGRRRGKQANNIILAMYSGNRAENSPRVYIYIRALSSP